MNTQQANWPGCGTVQSKDAPLRELYKGRRRRGQPYREELWSLCAERAWPTVSSGSSPGLFMVSSWAAWLLNAKL